MRTLIRVPLPRKPMQTFLFRRLLSNWEQVKTDSGETYYVHKKTREATFVGAVEPKDWEEVVDEPTGQVYYWCRATDETTALGAKKPTWMDDQRAAQLVPVQKQQQLVRPPAPQQQQSPRLGLLQYFLFGSAFASFFALVSSVF